MDTKYFHYILEIAACGSINRAAQNLGVSQPNLSVCVKNLEQELGFALFSRRSTGILLTREGQLFLESARKIVCELETIQNIPSLFSGKENLSVSSTYSSDFMQTFLQFKRQDPPRQHEDVFKETGLIQTVRDVIEQRYRLSLFYCFDAVSQAYRALAREHHLKLVPLTQDQPLALLVSRDNPLARRQEIPFHQIKGLPFVMYENFKFEEWLRLLGFESDEKVLYVFDRGGLIDTIQQSRYVTVTMKSAAPGGGGGCVEIPVTQAPYALNTYLLHHAGYTLNPREKRFIKLLKARLRPGEPG